MNNHTGTKLTKKPLVAAIAFATSIMAAPIYAQTSEDAESDQATPKTEEIVVYGIRSSLMQALEEKRNSSEIMDAISAEDIGQLPDDNIAEALRRVTGVAITRDVDGEGENLQLRGLANRNIQINGVPLAVTNDRNINFSDFNSGLFEGLEVFKSARADKPEGGLGGSINLKTRKPSSLKGPTATLTVANRTSRSTENDQPQANLLLGNNWKTEHGKFGVLGSVAYTEVDSRGDNSVVAQYRGYAYNNNNKPAFADFNGDGAVTNADDQLNVFFPSQFRTRSIFKSSERLGGQLALDWKPNDNWHLMLEGSSFRKEEEKREPQVRISAGTNGVLSVDDQFNPQLSSRVINVLDPNGGSVPFYLLNAGTVTERNNGQGHITVDMNSDSYNENTSDTTTLAFKTTYQTDGFKVEAQIARSQADVEVYDFDTRYRYRTNLATSYDFDLGAGDQPVFTPYIDGEVLDLTSVDNLEWRDIERNYLERESIKDDFRVDFTDYVDFGPIKSYKLGVRMAQEVSDRDVAWRETTVFRNDSDTANEPLIAGDPGFDACTGPLNLDNFLGGALGNRPFSDFITNGCDYDEVTAALGLDDIRVNGDERLGAIDKVTESIDSIYAMIEFEQPLPFGDDMAISGNFGVRYSEIDVESKGFDQTLVLDVNGNPVRDTDGNLEVVLDSDGDILSLPVKFDHDYSYVLPSLNVNLRLKEDLFLRFGAAKVVQAPNINQLRPGTEWNNGGIQDGIAFESRAGNPALEPKEAYAYDMSLEWYFAEGGLLSIAPFLKDWKVNTENRVVFEQIGDETIAIRRPVDLNAEYGEQKGIELGYQHEFTFLPGLLKHTGINANYTYVEIEDDLESLTIEGIPRSFQNRIAKNSYNASIWYDDGRLSARVAYSWRDDWQIGNVTIAGITGNGNAALVPGSSGALRMMQEEIGVLDASLNYQVTDSLKFSFSAVNINDDLKNNYSGYTEIPRGSAWSGTSYKFSLKYDFF